MLSHLGILLCSVYVGSVAFAVQREVLQVKGGGCVLDLDARTGRILAVNGTSLRSGERGLWRVRLQNGTTFDQAAFEAHPEGRIVREGSTFTYHEGHASVTIAFKPCAEGVDLCATVTAGGEDPVTEMELPARLRFDSVAVDRFYMPSRGNQGLGFAFNRAFFEETSRLRTPTWRPEGSRPWKRTPAAERSAKITRDLAAALHRSARPKLGLVWLPCGPEWGSGESVNSYELRLRKGMRAVSNECSVVRLASVAALEDALSRDDFRLILNPYGDLVPMRAAAEIPSVKSRIKAYERAGGVWVSAVALADIAAFVPRGYCSYGFAYPNLFMDFCQLVTAEGSALSLYGVRPRPPHPPWKLAREHHFVPGSLVCGGDECGGYVDHAFRMYLKKGETVRLPAVRLAAGRPLRMALDDYARANDLTRPLSEKASPERLAKLKEAVNAVIYGGRHDACTKVVDRLPAPALVHVQRYLKGGFDKEYPDHLPTNVKAFGTDAQHRAFIDHLHARGHLYMPYTNPTWWCDEPRGPTFLAAGDAPLLVDEKGRHHPEHYGRNRGWTTCLWHPAVIAANRRTRTAFTTTLPADVLFQDQCGARRSPLDFNPASPSPTAYAEGMISLVEDDAAYVPLGTEDGWDKVANAELALFGCMWKMCPRCLGVEERDYHTLDKEIIPPEAYTIEPLALYLMHEKCLFYHHDLSGTSYCPRVLAWQLATGVNFSVNVSHYPYLKDEEHRVWCDYVAMLQKKVMSRIAGRRLDAWRHDRAPLFTRTDVSPCTRADDGVIYARWGDVDCVVNLGDVPRQAAGVILAPYGYRIAAPGLLATFLNGRKPEIKEP